MKVSFGSAGGSLNRTQHEPQGYPILRKDSETIENYNTYIRNRGPAQVPSVSGCLN